ncbi:MAG: hypothetical protein MI923_30275 [Phycisphaerales bacterium]|nr:hypothetical protein [Phycisphaerales bacterium]
MRRILFLAWRYVAYHRGKTAILTAALTLTTILPLSAHLLIDRYGESLIARAQATPLVLGAKGNRFDLVLKALYFSPASVDPVYMSEVDSIRESELGEPIPLHLRFTARKRPLVGTTLEYFEFRALSLRNGALPTVLGQAVLGSKIAAELEKDVGSSLFSDQQTLYDITKTYPLKMSIVGVLKESGTPDDEAVFVDIKTAWIIEGIMHGHQDVTTVQDESVILGRDNDTVVANASIVQYHEVTPENVDSFHTHSASDELPVTAIIVVPSDLKSGTLLKARYNLSESQRMLVPLEVVEELMHLVFRIKRFFDANFALILVSTGLFIALVVLLSHRLRKREMETMHKIGCSRLTVFWLQAAELAIVLTMSLAVSVTLSLVVVSMAPHIMRLK